MRLRYAFTVFIKLVSIHASVKDATTRKDHEHDQLSVSIHASVKDATKVCVYRFHQVGFNPRICKRCDPMFVKSFIDDTFKL